MKTIIVLFALIAMVVGTASAQIGGANNLKDPATPLARSVTLPATAYKTAFTDQAGTMIQYGYYWKYWAGPKLWSANDTTEWSSTGALKDTSLAYYLKTAGTIYHAAIYIQFGNSAPGGVAPQVRPAYLLDSTGRTGATPAWKHGVGDSIIVGRKLDFIRSITQHAACNQFRFIVAKDTANCSALGQLYVIGTMSTK